MIRAILLAAIAGAGATAEPVREVRFIACPIYRDTDNGRKSGCWLANDPRNGTRYDVTAAPTKPDWNHAILVEGRPSATAGDPCGGDVLEPVRVSVLPDPCTRYMIAAEGYQGRRFALPERNVRPLYEDRTRPAAPFAVGRFTIPFDFGSSFVTYQLADYYIDAAINYAIDVQPARTTISGRAQTEATDVSGQSIAEPQALADTRAELVRRALVMRGVDPASITIAPSPDQPLDARAFDTLTGPTDRRVDIVITPVMR